MLEKDFDEENGGVIYLVDWLGYGVEDRTWEPASVLEEDAPDMVRAFEERQKNLNVNSTSKSPKGKGR